MKRILILFLSIVVISCQKSNDPESTKLIPLDMGNYWIYEVEAYEGIGAGDRGIDSIIIDGTKTIEGKTGKILSHYSSLIGEEYTKTSETILLDQGGNLYSGLGSISNLLELLNIDPDSITDDGWILVADQENENWDNGNFDLPTINLENSPLNLLFEQFNVEVDSIKGEVFIFGEQYGNGNYMMNGNDYNTEIYRNTFQFDIILWGSFNNFPLNGLRIELAPTSDYHFIKGIGLAVIDQSPVVLEFFGMEIINFSGTRQDLIRYKIN